MRTTPPGAAQKLQRSASPLSEFCSGLSITRYIYKGVSVRSGIKTTVLLLLLLLLLHLLSSLFLSSLFLSSLFLSSPPPSFFFPFSPLLSSPLPSSPLPSPPLPSPPLPSSTHLNQHHLTRLSLPHPSIVHTDSVPDDVASSSPELSIYFLFRGALDFEAVEAERFRVRLMTSSSSSLSDRSSYFTIGARRGARVMG